MRADRQTDRQTRFSQYFAPHTDGESNNRLFPDTHIVRPFCQVHSTEQANESTGEGRGNNCEMTGECTSALPYYRLTQQRPCMRHSTCSRLASVTRRITSAKRLIIHICAYTVVKATRQVSQVDGKDDILPSGNSESPLNRHSSTDIVQI